MSKIIKPENINEIYYDILEPAMHGRMEYTLMNDFLSKYSFQNNLSSIRQNTPASKLFKSVGGGMNAFFVIFKVSINIFSKLLF